MKPRASRAKRPPSSAPHVRRTPAASFPVVGIGASAGGLEAVTSLLRSLPAETGMGFVLVQHLDPTHESALTTLLSRTTRMTVLEAQDGLLVQPDHARTKRWASGSAPSGSMPAVWHLSPPAAADPPGI